MNKKGNELANQGKLIADATVAPADISYPTDLELLNQAREVTEEIIDSLYQSLLDKEKKSQEHIVRKRGRII